MEKLTVFNNMVDSYGDSIQNTHNFIIGLNLFYDNFNKFYNTILEVEKLLGEKLIILPSFKFDSEGNEPKNKFEELRFKVNNKTKNEVESILNNLDDYKYSYEEAIYVLRFK